MKRTLFTAAATAVVLLVGTAPARAEETKEILETGCFPSAPSTTVSPDKTSAEAKLTVTCKLGGVELVKFEFTSKTKGQDCTEPSLSYGQGSGMASLKADSSATCKLNESGEGGVTYGQQLKDPLGLVVAEINNGADFTGQAGDTLTNTSHSEANASTGPLANLEQDFNGIANGNGNIGSSNGNLNGNYNWGSFNGNGNGNFNGNFNGNGNIGSFNGSHNGNYNW